jgi:hypothetical protein
VARIRSYHPWLWTDERFVALSLSARLLYLGVQTEADDQGVFEHKPLQLKMRLFPADGVDVPGLLQELIAADLVATFTVGERAFLAIRDFRRWQRPKKPNALHPLPHEWRTYVAIEHAGAELGEADGGEVPKQFPTGSEIRPQREDGGGKRRRYPPKPPAGASIELRPWQGPDEVRQAIECRLHERAAGYLHYFTWRELPERALVTASPTMFRKLKDCEPELRAIGWQLLLERAA